MKKTAYKLYKESVQSYNKFSTLWNTCKHLQSECYLKHLEYIQQSLQCDPRQFRGYFNDSRKSNSVPNQMFWNNETTGNGCEITNLFAGYFFTTYTDTKYVSPNYNQYNLINLTSINLSLPQVFDAICKLKPKFSHGSDGIQSILLAKYVCALSKLLHLFSVYL